MRFARKIGADISFWRFSKSSSAFAILKKIFWIVSNSFDTFSRSSFEDFFIFFSEIDRRKETSSIIEFFKEPDSLVWKLDRDYKKYGKIPDICKFLFSIKFLGATLAMRIQRIRSRNLKGFSRPFKTFIDSRSLSIVQFSTDPKISRNIRARILVST